jgi:hypothetical protein
MWQRVSLVLGAIFFLSVGFMATYAELPKLKKQVQDMFSSQVETGKLPKSPGGQSTVNYTVSPEQSGDVKAASGAKKKD